MKRWIYSFGWRRHPAGYKSCRGCNRECGVGHTPCCKVGALGALLGIGGCR